MKAIRIHEFGGPEVMKIEEIEIPVPKADEILVKMFASGINPADYVVRQGGNVILKPFLKLPLEQHGLTQVQLKKLAATLASLER